MDLKNKIYAIHNIEILDVLWQIEDAVVKLQNKRVSNQDIRILMPKYFQRILYLFNKQNLHSAIESNLIFGIEIVAHYKNEIVVYDWIFDPNKQTNDDYIIINLQQK